MELPPLVYVYTGNPLPRYARHSLEGAKRRYAGKVIVLSDIPQSLRGIEIQELEGWYDPEPFTTFCEKSPLDPSFRGGFWLRAAERFFVLEQFMRHHKIQSMYHVEMDVMILDLDGFARKLDAFGSGLFAPMEAPGRAIASLMYVNDFQALGKLCDYTVQNAHLGNEMFILGHFIEQHPEWAHSLPSDQVFDEYHWPYAPSTVPPHDGLVDGTAFGMWLFGWDPRNSDRSMFNLRKQSLTKHPIESLRFSMKSPGLRLSVQDSKGRRFQVRTLHVHSKIFGRLQLKPLLRLYLWLASRNMRVVIVPRWSSPIAWVLNALLSKRAARMYNFFPRGLRHALAGFLWKISMVSPRLLSNRQRGIINQLLPGLKVRGNPAPLTVIIDYVDREEEHLRRTLDSLDNSVHMVEEVILVNSEKDVVPQCLASWAHTGGDEASVRVSLLPKMDTMALATSALKANTPGVVIISAGQTIPPASTLLSIQGDQALFFGEEKRQEGIEHAIAFWSERRLSNRTSFDETLQVLQPQILREMFPAEGDISKWGEVAVHPGVREPNLIQSYGAWIMSEKPRLVNVCSRRGT